MKNTALLIIDMINDFNFDHGQLLADSCRHIVQPILALKERMHEWNMPIIYINDHYNLWKADMQLILSHCRNERSKHIVDQMNPEATDHFLIKPHYSAFYETPLSSLLNHLQVEQLILTGIAGNICVLFTANDAHMRHYPIYVPRDCIASNYEQDNKHALSVMQQILKADTRPSCELAFPFV